MGSSIWCELYLGKAVASCSLLVQIVLQHPLAHILYHFDEAHVTGEGEVASKSEELKVHYTEQDVKILRESDTYNRKYYMIQILFLMIV